MGLCLALVSQRNAASAGRLPGFLLFGALAEARLQGRSAAFIGLLALLIGALAFFHLGLAKIGGLLAGLLFLALLHEARGLARGPAFLRFLAGFVDFLEFGEAFGLAGRAEFLCLQALFVCLAPFFQARLALFSALFPFALSSALLAGCPCLCLTLRFTTGRMQLFQALQACFASSFAFIIRLLAFEPGLSGCFAWPRGFFAFLVCLAAFLLTGLPGSCALFSALPLLFRHFAFLLISLGLFRGRQIAGLAGWFFGFRAGRCGASAAVSLALGGFFFFCLALLFCQQSSLLAVCLEGSLADQVEYIRLPRGFAFHRFSFGQALRAQAGKQFVPVSFGRIQGGFHFEVLQPGLFAAQLLFLALEFVGCPLVELVLAAVGCAFLSAFLNAFRKRHAPPYSRTARLPACSTRRKPDWLIKSLTNTRTLGKPSLQSWKATRPPGTSQRAKRWKSAATL